MFYVALVVFIFQAHSSAFADDLYCESFDGVYAGQCTTGSMVLKNEHRRIKTRVGYSHNPNGILSRSTCQQVTIDSWIQGNGSRVLFPRSFFYDIYEQVAKQVDSVDIKTGTLKKKNSITTKSYWENDQKDFVVMNQTTRVYYKSDGSFEREKISTEKTTYQLDGEKLRITSHDDFSNTATVCEFEKIAEVESLQEEFEARK